MLEMSLSEYQDSVDYLFGLQKHGIKFGLNSTNNLLTRLGNPHRSLRCIHIAGTNGKGSTAAMLSSMLRKHGVRVGLYTSPHLVRFTERFRIDEREVGTDRILAIFEKVRKQIDDREPPTFFEVVTAMALLLFAEEKVEWAVIETGMGGRLDATNVIHPRVSVITNVTFDHQEYLGCTLSSIAREKAGIIKEEVPVVTGVTQPLVHGVLTATCQRKRAVLYRLGKEFKARRRPGGAARYQGLKWDWPSLELSLPGVHQVRNAALAIAVLEVLEEGGDFYIDSGAVELGLSAVHWPARLEILGRRPLILLDGAHNPQGAESLRDALRNCFTYQKLHLVMGIMEDKDIAGIFRRLLSLAETVIFTQPRYSRAAKADRLRQLAMPFTGNHYVIPDVAEAIQQAGRFAGPDDLICITGSLYFAGEVKELFGEPIER